MSRERVKVTAIVTVTLQLELTQPWSPNVGMDVIHKQAKDSARGALDSILGTREAKGVNAYIRSDLGKVRIITEDVES